MYAYIYIYGDFALNKRAPILNFIHPWPVCESDKAVYVQVHTYIYYNKCNVVSSVRWLNLLSSSINSKHFRSLACVGFDTFYRKIHTKILYSSIVIRMRSFKNGMLKNVNWCISNELHTCNTRSKIVLVQSVNTTYPHTSNETHTHAERKRNLMRKYAAWAV